MIIRKAFVLLLIASHVLLTGCALPEKYPIEKIQNILIVGVDIVDGQVKLTAVVDKINKGSESGKEQISAEIYSATGPSVFEAKRTLHTYANKRTSWYHLKYILIGEEAAKQDIGNVLDFFCENDENRFLHRLIVAKGMTAENFLTSTVTHTTNVTETLDSLFEDTSRTGLSSEVHLLDYASSCECKWSCVYIPTVEMVPATHHASAGGEQSKDDPDNLTKLSGYALFNNSRLAGYIDGDAAIGMNIVINQLESAAITVTDMHGQTVSLEIMSSNASIKTDIGDVPSATVKVMITAFMVEYHETQGATDEAYIAFLEKQLSANIQDIIVQALLTGQQYKTDAFGIGSTLYHSYPIASKPFKSNWNEIFSTIKITVSVTSKIQCTYSMLNAAGG